MPSERPSHPACPGCGFDLAGLPDQPTPAGRSRVLCPECGAPSIITPRGAVQPWRWRLSRRDQARFLALLFFMPTLSFVALLLAIGALCLLYWTTPWLAVVAVVLQCIGACFWFVLSCRACIEWAHRVQVREDPDARPPTSRGTCFRVVAPVAVNALLIVPIILIIGALA